MMILALVAVVASDNYGLVQVNSPYFTVGIEATDGILGTRTFMKLGSAAHGAVYAAADGESVDLAGTSVNLWLRDTPPLVDGTAFQIEEEDEARIATIDYVGGIPEFNTTMPFYFQNGIIGQDETPSTTFALRGKPVMLQTPTVSTGQLFGVVNGIGGGSVTPLSYDIASGIYTLSLGSGVSLKLQADTSVGTGVIKAGASNGAVRYGGEAEIGIDTTATATTFVASVAKSITTSSKTLVHSWYGSGLDADWISQTATCTAGVVTVDVQSPYIAIQPNNAACTVTFTKTTANTIGKPIRGVVAMVTNSPGAGTVKFAGLTYSPTLCSTTGIVLGESITIAYDTVLDSWTTQACD
jgi:hypothetical protein